jgi:diketogulonate reductase-like aldo/keto reductase
MAEVKLPTGETVPALGVGTWHMGERARPREQEVAALRYALDLGIRVIDTAEMYGSGAAEEIVGEAIEGRRDEVFLVTKLYPHNATTQGTIEACERSLQRLNSEMIDLYLVHWRGDVPLAETVEAFERLKAEGKIRHWGVSNYDARDMEELLGLEAGGACAANQVLYHLAQRGIERELLPLCRERAIPIMAYTPLGDGRVLGESPVPSIAAKHDTGPAAVALAWLMRNQGVMVIPKASQAAHVEEIAQAPEIRLDEEDLSALEAAFPPA